MRQESTLPWTDRDLDILRTLALRVRMLTLSNIANIWWECSKQQLPSARSRLLKLSRAGFLHRYEINVHPPLPLELPSFCWRPGKQPPNGEKLSYHFRSRWSKVAHPTSVYVATPRTIHMFASYGKGRIGGSLEWDHDLHVGQIYLVYRKARPTDATNWVGEDAYPTAGYRIKEPDAFLENDAGERIRAVEFAGRYDAERIRAFHIHCREYELPYELW